MKNLSLFKKFIITGALFGAIMVFVMVAVLVAANVVGGSSEKLSQKEIPVLNSAHQLKLSVVQVQQWLTDISATRGLDGLNDGFDEAAANAETFRSIIARLKKLDSEHAQQYESMLPVFENYYRVGRKMAQAYIDEGPAGGNRMMGEFDAVAATMAEKVDTFLEQSQVRAEDLLAKQRELIKSSTRTLVISFMVMVIVMGISAWVMFMAIRQMPVMASELRRIADGDLTGPLLEVKSADEVGILAKGLNEMKTSLKEIIAHLRESADKLMASVEHMEQVSESTSEAIHTQQNDVNQVATAMNEMSATSHEVASHASSAAAAARDADEEARQGRRVVEEVIGTIEGMARQVADSAEAIATLGRSSEEIGTIIGTIRGIADQTNLLALNAAIEAARAGEQGRGFAVVADEVRTLASRTQDATGEIEEMIAQLQSGSRNAVSAMEASREQANHSLSEAGRAGDRLAAIDSAVATISDMNTHIATAAEEQSAVAEEMNRNIIGINQASDQTAEGAREIEQAGHHLTEMATELKGLVAKFKV